MKVWAFEYLWQPVNKSGTRECAKDGLKLFWCLSLWRSLQNINFLFVWCADKTKHLLEENHKQTHMQTKNHIQTNQWWFWDNWEMFSQKDEATERMQGLFMVIQLRSRRSKYCYWGETGTPRPEMLTSSAGSFGWMSSFVKDRLEVSRNPSTQLICRYELWKEKLLRIPQ